MSSNGGASNPNLPSQMKKLSSASTVIQTYVASILHQADISLPKLPKLAHHQATARTHSLYWQNTIMPLLTKTITEVIDFGNEFNSFYATLVQFADIIMINTAGDKSQLVQGLQYLAKTVQDKDNNAQAVLTDLNTFHTNVNTDYQNFSTDERDASVKITGANGDLVALANQLDLVNAGINEDISQMADGTAAGVIGAGVVGIFVGGFVALVGGGVVSVGLVVAGVGAIGTGISMEAKGAVQFSSNNVNQLSSIKEKIAADNQGLISLKTVKGQLNGFESGLNNAITATSELQKGWSALKVHLEELILAVQRIDPTATPVFLKPLLRGAKKDWDDALVQAKKLLPSGQMAIPVIKVAKIQSVIHA